MATKACVGNQSLRKCMREKVSLFVLFLIREIREIRGKKNK